MPAGSQLSQYAEPFIPVVMFFGVPPSRIDGEDVTARDALVAHDAADEGDLLAVGRPARDRDLGCWA